MSLCNEETLVNGNIAHGHAVTLRCKRWSCPICQPFNRWKLIRSAKAGDPNTFITLTVNPAWGESPDMRARALSHAWRTVRRLACKRYGMKRFPFICVFEKTKKGEPHLHILCRTKWISQKWLSEVMQQLMGAPIVDIRRIQDKGRAAAYVTKYVGKDPNKFEGTKRHWRSQDYLPEEFNDKPITQLFGEIWLRHRKPIDQIHARLVQQGYSVKRWPHKLEYDYHAGG